MATRRPVISNTDSTFHTFSGNSQNLSENVSCFVAKMIDMSVLSQKNQTLQVLFGWNIELWQNLFVWVGGLDHQRVHVAYALRPVRSIPVTIFLTSQGAERFANDALLTSFRATLSSIFSHRVWLKGRFHCQLRYPLAIWEWLVQFGSQTTWFFKVAMVTRSRSSTNFFFNSLFSFEWTWPFWSPWNAFYEEAV